MSTKTLLTTYGNNRILQAIADNTYVPIVAIAYGDGDGSSYEPSIDQTSLKHQIGQLTSIEKVFNSSDGFIYFKATIPANADAFTLREFGLLDNLGNLISVTVVPDIEKPVASDGVSIALPISIGFKTSTGEVLVIVEDGTDVYANIDLTNLTASGEHHFDNTYATIDLNNLSLEGERHFLGRTHITNCMTEVPQRILCTLDSGVLTLKSGSTIIVPFGTEDLSSTYQEGATFLNENFKVAETQYIDNKFFVWAIVQEDISTTYTSGANNLSVFVRLEDNILSSYDRLTDASGDSMPSGLTASFYNTTTNNINRYSAGTQASSNLSFPIVRVTSTSSEIATIDEISNGINHIGNTIILDKDVRLLIPNGRNENGSLHNEVYMTQSITMRTLVESIYDWAIFYNYTKNTIGYFVKEHFFESSPNDTLDYNRVYYDFTTNKFTQYVDSIKTEELYCPIGLVYKKANSTKISKFSSKLAFRAVDYNDYSSTVKSINNDISLINTEIETMSTFIRKIGDPIITLSNTLQNDEVWLEGATVSRSTYSNLYKIYGTTYGAGDGSTTFKLPDFRNRAIWGANSFGYLSAGIPNITGWFRITETTGDASTIQGSSGAFRHSGAVTGGEGHIQTTSNRFYQTVTFDASRSSSLYGSNSTVQPPAIKVRVKTRYK